MCIRDRSDGGETSLWGGIVDRIKKQPQYIASKTAIGKPSPFDKEMKTWRHRLQTAEQRNAELLQRLTETEENLQEANLKPAEIAQNKIKIGSSIETAQARLKEASDALSLGETNLRECVQRERDAERAASEAREQRAVSKAKSDAAKDQQAKAANLAS